MATFLVPEDFRAFMKSVVLYLDTPSEEKFLDSEAAVDHECGYGGRIDGIDTYQFKYITKDGHHRWDVIVREAQIRDVADGILIELEADRFDLLRTQRRMPIGEPLLIWGEQPDDALSVRSEQELLASLDTLHASAIDRPRMLRMWTAADDQLVAAVWGDDCALYIIDSADGYATSMGNQERNDSFEVLDHEGRALNVPWADCVSWEYARRALVRFIEHSDLGDIPVEGRIPSLLLMLGDIDRKAALAARTHTPRELARSSLPRMATEIPVASDAPDPSDEHGADEATATGEVDDPLGQLQRSSWGLRLLDLLRARQLVEVGRGQDVGQLSYRLGGLLQEHAHHAEISIETAEWLAGEIGAVPGISKLLVTADDLQVVLRASRDF